MPSRRKPLPLIYGIYISHSCQTSCSKLCHITYSVYHHSNNNFTFFGFNPCLKTCSRTIKKCCKGILSESSIRPYFSDVSISSLTISFDMLTKLLLSIITGSRTEIKKKKNYYAWFHATNHYSVWKYNNNTFISSRMPEYEQL